jgi:hypothetical protein
MRSIGIPSPAFQVLSHVFPEYVCLEIHAIASLSLSQSRLVKGVRNECDRKPTAIRVYHSERDPVHSNRSFLHEQAREVGGASDAHQHILPVSPDPFDRTDAIDVTLHEMTIEPTIGAQCAFQVDAIAGRPITERCPAQRLWDGRKGESRPVARGHRQAASVDADAVPDADPIGEPLGHFDVEVDPAPARLEACDSSDGRNDSREQRLNAP